MLLLGVLVFLKRNDVTSIHVTLVMLGLFVGVMGNAFWAGGFFFVNFGLITLVTAYIYLSNTMASLPSLPSWFLIVFFSYAAGSVISRFSLKVFGVGT